MGEKHAATIDDLRAEVEELRDELDRKDRQAAAALRAANSKHMLERDELEATIEDLESVIDGHEHAIDAHSVDSEKLSELARNAATRAKGLHETHAEKIAEMEHERLTLLKGLAEEHDSREVEHTAAIVALQEKLTHMGNEHAVAQLTLKQQRVQTRETRAYDVAPHKLKRLTEELAQAKKVAGSHVASANELKAHSLALQLAQDEAKETIATLRGEIAGANTRVESLLGDDATRALSAQIQRLELELREQRGRSGRGGVADVSEELTRALAEIAKLNLELQVLHSSVSEERGRRVEVMSNFGDSVPRSEHVKKVKQFEREVALITERRAQDREANERACAERAAETETRFKILAEAAGAQHRGLEGQVAATILQNKIDRVGDEAMIDALQAAIRALEAKLAQPLADAAVAEATIAESDAALKEVQAAAAAKDAELIGALTRERSAAEALRSKLVALESEVESLTKLPPPPSASTCGGSPSLSGHMLAPLPPHVPTTSELSSRETQRALFRALLCVQRLALPTSSGLNDGGSEAAAAAVDALSSACDDWNYVDASGTVRGSYSRDEMQRILSMNEYDASLPVRLGSQGRFVPLAQVAKGDLRSAFDLKLKKVLIEGREAMRPAVERAEQYEY